MTAFINGFPIDAVIREEQTLTSEVTQNPVEAGSDVVDNVRNLPLRVTLECLVSDTPLEPIASLRAAENSLQSPSTDAYNNILAIRDAKEPVTLVTPNYEHDNMVLESLTVPDDAGTGDALVFTLSFVQVEFLTNDRVTVEVSIPRAKKKANKGNKATSDAPSSARLTNATGLRRGIKIKGRFTPIGESEAS